MANSPVLDKLRAERDQVRNAAVKIAESENFDPESDENYQDLETRAVKLDKRIESLSNLLTEQAAADALDGRMAKASKAVEDQQRASLDGQRAETRGSWGEVFTRSEIFTDYQAIARGRSSHVTVNDDLQTRALPTGLSDLIDAGLTFGKTTVNVQPPTIPTPLLDAISTITVNSNAIEYVSMEVVAGGPAVVPEKGPKPSIEYGPVVTADTLEMIAVHTQLTRQLLEDAGSVRDYIDTDLRRQILIKEESEAAGVIGDADLTTATGDSLLAAIRVAIANVQTEGYSPNAVMLNPADYADLDLDVMGATVNGPTISQRFWGLSPIPVPSQTAGTAIVGDFRTAVNHFVRSAVALYITDSHAETFLSNVFTLLAERRSKTAVVKPAALSLATAGSGS